MNILGKGKKIATCIGKRILPILLVGILIVMSGCEKKRPISNLANPDKTDVSDVTEDKGRQEEFSKSTPQNDTDIGLKTIKVDTAERKLTDEQKAILKYFDNDYLTVPTYEFLRRYPKVYTNAQLHIGGYVKKIISVTNEEYKLLLWLGKGEEAFFYRSDYTEADYEKYLEENKGNFVLISGTSSDVLFVENDYLTVYGKYTGIETVEVDGTSYTVPVINSSKAYIDDELVAVERYDSKYIKTIAEAIFGLDIEVRKPVANEDYKADMEWRVFDEKPFYIAEPEDQSNAKFTKYRFYTQNGYIEDAKTGADFWLLGNDSNIQRNIEFSADFKHFFLFTYDKSLENLTLEYYDSSFSKIWKREFAETTTALYDYTKNNIYLVANNELYIINTETGEDTFRPTYVGAKKALRKLSDGILMISESKSDGVMKSSLDGSIIWKTNLNNNVYSADGVQLIGENIVVQMTDEDLNTHYIVLNNKDGSVVEDAVSIKNS